MRFNPKARLDTSRIRDSGRGGGMSGGGMSGGGMRIPIPGGARAGGGIGGIVILLLFFALTQCVGGGGGLSTGSSSQGGMDTSRMADTERYQNCKTGQDANTDVDCARVAVENSLVAYWTDQLPAQGGPDFTPATVETFSGGVGTSGCGQATSQTGPFYCPGDQHVYLDTTFFSDILEGQLGGKGGDFVEPYVLAHEYGHHIQNLLGTMSKVRTQQGAESDSVRLELQADCYAGMWAKAASGGDGILTNLDQGDINEALDSAKTVGDDRIQQQTGQKVNSDGWTHGSSEQRMRWFTTGYEQGTLDACDTFGADTL